MNFRINIWTSSPDVILGHHHRQIDGHMDLRLLLWSCRVLHHNPHHLPEILIPDLDSVRGRHHRQRGVERDLDLHAVDAPEVDPGHLFNSEVGALVDLLVDQMTNFPRLSCYLPFQRLSLRFLHQWHPRSLFDPDP